MIKKIDIKITYRCNNHCQFCVRDYRQELLRDRTFKEIVGILESHKKQCQEVIFTGGECTSKNDIISLVNYAKKIGYIVVIQSNGRMFFYKDFCKEIIRAGADKFHISLHGHNAKLHDYLTGVKGSFEQTTNGIRNILSFGKILSTNTVINKLNYRLLPQIATLLIKIGVWQYQFAFPHILGRAYENWQKIVPRKSDVISYVRKGIKVGKKKRKMVQVEAIPYCFLAGYEDCVSDQYIPDVKIFDIGISESFEQWRKNEGKIKGPNCIKCKYFQKCEGPWREYPQLFGWSEFIPVK